MIVLLVYRPEAGDNTDETHAQNPFNGVEVYTCTPLEKTVKEVIARESLAHPDWQWHFSEEPLRSSGEMLQFLNSKGA